MRGSRTATIALIGLLCACESRGAGVESGVSAVSAGRELAVLRAAARRALDEAPDRTRLFYDPRLIFSRDSARVLASEVAGDLRAAGLTRYSPGDSGTFSDTTAAILGFSRVREAPDGTYRVHAEWYVPGAGGGFSAYSDGWDMTIECRAVCVVREAGRVHSDYGPG